MQAVVKIGTSQYLVTPGQKLLVDKAQIDAVLVVIADDKIVIGQPEVKGATVTLADLGEVKGEKIRVSKFKAKSRYKKTVGFRPRYRQVEVKDISLNIKPSKKI